MKMCRWKVWSSLALSFALLCSSLLRADTRMTILRDTGQGDEPEEAARVVWPTDPGIRYELQESDDLEHWTTVEGFPSEAQALAQQYIIMRETAGTRRFFRVRPLDEQPPAITQRIPAHGAFGVRRFSAITIEMDDITGVDPASISMTVGTHGSFTLADAELSYVDGTLVFDLGGDTALDGWGAVIEVSLTVADLLGNTETKDWTFRLELEPVYVEELFVFGSPDAIHLGQQVLPTPTTIMTQRWGNESGPIHMNDSADPWHLERVGEDHLVIGYEGVAPPHFVAGLYLANITPVTMNEIFYRKITAIEDDPALSQLTLTTVEVPFAEIALQDSFRLDEDAVAFEVDEDGGITRAIDLTTREGRHELESIEIDWSGMPVFGTYTGSEGSFESGFGLPLSGTPPGAASWDSQLILDQAYLRVTPELDLAFETSRLIELELLKADMVLRVDAALVPRYEIESESVATDERGTLWQQRYIIPVKMAWVHVQPSIDLAAGLSAGLSGSISGGATGGFSSYIVVDYERGRIPDVRYQHGILDRHFDVVQPSLLLNGPFNAYARLIAELDINVLSLTGFHVNVDPGTTLTGSATVQDLELASAELKIRLDAHLNAGMVLWGAGSPNGLPSLEPVSIVNPPWEYRWTHPEHAHLHFVQEPGNTTVREGQWLTLTSEARGPEAIRYQWYQDGLPIQTGRVLTRGNAHTGMAGQYHVRATSGGQSAVSKTATVMVSVPIDPEATPGGMMLIPGGTNAGTDPDVGAYSLVVDSFYMDRYPVSKALWDEVHDWAVTHGGYSFDRAGSGKAANHPVHTVNWYDVVKWCNARSEKEGRPAVYTVNGAVYRTGRSNDVVQTTAAGYRLPTDMEWEYAARGGLQSKRFPWGDTINHNHANYRANGSTYSYDTSPYTTLTYHPAYATGGTPHTSPVGSFAANGYGLHDMSGNVSEWCFDWHPSQVGWHRVLRGGSWDSGANLCRVAGRGNTSPSAVGAIAGFRSALSPDQEPEPVPTGTVWVDIKDADGTVRLSAGDLSAVQIHRVADEDERARVFDHGSNPVELSRVPYGIYFLKVYCRDMLAAVSLPFAVDAPEQTVVLHAGEYRPLAITVYYSDEQTPFGGATVKLDSWSGHREQWTERASGTTDAVSGSVTFQTWPTTLPGETYRVRILNGLGTQVNVHDNVTLADTDAGSSYSVTITQAPPPDPEVLPGGMMLIPGGTNAGTNPLGEGESYSPNWYPETYSLTVDWFYMDRYPVSKALWDEVHDWAVTHGGYSFDRAGSGRAANHPVHALNWHDVVKWCNARSEKEGRSAVYAVNGAVYRTGRSSDVVQTTAAGYRLPTDVEWEYAARGGLESKRFPWGDTINHNHANYRANRSTYSYDTSPYTTLTYHPAYATGSTPYTSPVGSFAANGYWLHDMSGNVWEWVFDWHPSHVGSSRVLRGGSWEHGADRCRVAGRGNSSPTTAGAFTGFRSVLSPDQELEPVPTGTVWADIMDAGGTVRLSEGDLSAVHLHRVADEDERARVMDPGSNPVELSRVAYGIYALKVFCRDMRVAVSSPFTVDAPDQTVALHASEKRPLEITAYYSDGQTPLGGATVKLDSWNGYSGQWTERASDTADAASGSVVFLTWPTTLPGERYRVRIHNFQMSQVGVHDNVTVADTGAGSSYSMTTSQALPPDPEVLPEGMVQIPGGTNSGTDPDFGAYILTANPFFMDRYPVTKALWDEVYDWAVTHRGYDFDNAGSGKAANHPVHTVNWFDMVKWCNARSEKEGRPAVYTVEGAVYRTGRNDVVQTDAAGYRLPTRVEWEYAARGGLESTRFPWGDTIDHSHANYLANRLYGGGDASPYTTFTYHPEYATGGTPYTSPVGSFAPNGYGLYDMIGNVWERCFNSQSTQTGSPRFYGGGGWSSRAELCRVEVRNTSSPDIASDSMGFRSMLSPGPQPDPIPTGLMRVEVKDAGGITKVLLYRASDNGEQARITDPSPHFSIMFSRVPYGTYSLTVFCWDMLVKVSAPFALDSPDQTVVLQAGEKRPLTIGVYYSDGQTPIGGATVKLDSWNGYSEQWTERATGTSDADSGSATFLTWPTTLPGERYRVRILDFRKETVVGVHDNVTLADTSTGSSYSVTTSLLKPGPAPYGMVLIPGGTNAGSDLNSMPYSLSVNSFYMDCHEVTKELWAEVYLWAVTHGGYSFDNAGASKAANHPVQDVNWYDVVKWCNARSEKEGRPAVYTVNGAVYRTGQADNVVQTSAVGYRLPTHVEWRYAARGGLRSRRFPWGDKIDHTHANYTANRFNSYGYDSSPYTTDTYHPEYATGGTPYTSPVGSFAPNGYGLYDMIGNVSELFFSATGTPQWRAAGGSYHSIAVHLTNSQYSSSVPLGRFPWVGFRTVLPVQ